MKQSPLYLITARKPEARVDDSPRVRGVGGKEFTSAFENAAIGMALVAPDSSRLRVNKAFCTMLGYREAEMMARTVGHITHPDDVAEDFRQRELCLSGAKHTYQREKRYLHRDGSVVWGHLTCTLVRDDADRPMHFISQVQDITQRKRAEAHLRDAQSLLHMAAQVGRLGAWAYEVGHPTVTWSEEACAIHEVRQGFAPTAEQAVAFFAPGYRERMGGILRACLREGTPFDVEAQLVTAKGRPIWVRVIGEAEWDAQGRVRRLLGAIQDISEARRAAEESRVMAQRLTTTLESLTDAFFTIDRHWRFTYVNAQAERLTRRRRQDILGRRVFDMYPELAEIGMRSEMERAMTDNVTVELESYYPPFAIWVRVKIFPSEQGLAVDIKDVTDQIDAQREVLRLNAQLEERVKQRTAQLLAANKELEAFSYSIAHDLRAPLSSIDGFSLMLETTLAPELADSCRHYLRRIRGGVRQMGELTDGLLALSNLSRASLRSEAVDLAALAQAAVASCRESSPERAVEVVIAPCLPVMGDPRLLAQVIGNLVGNAWKFTSRKEHACIEVGSVAGPDGAPVFFVRDNGAGFDMAYACRMFEAFQRMHSAVEFDGTGIGLAIVHKIVTRHGGRVWAEAAPDRGATFHFTLGQS